MLNRIFRFIIAVIVSTLVISIGSTQVVLASVRSFGVEVDLATHFSSTLTDLLGLGPVLLMLVACAYLPGFILAFLLSKLIFNQFTWGIIAGLTAIPAAVALVHHVVDIEVFYITSSLAGWLVLIIGSLIGSLLFHRMAPGYQSRKVVS